MGIQALKNYFSWIRATPLLGGLAGLLLGWSVWQPSGLSVAWLLMLSVFSAPKQSRVSRFCVFFGYYLAALNLPLTSLRDYDPTPSGALLAGLGQLLLAITLAAPYAFFAGGKRGQAWRVGAGSIMALVLTAVPPLGCVGLASPLFGATAWFPGLGTAGLILYLLLFGLSVTVLHRFSPSSSAVYLLGIIIPVAIIPAIGATSNTFATHGGLYCSYAQACPKHQIMTISYPFGRTVQTWSDFEKRASLITKLGDKVLEDNPQTRLLIYPEEVAGPLDQAFIRLYAHFANVLRRHHATAALGALIPWRVQTPSRKQQSQTIWSDGIVFIGQHNRVLIARQPAPVVEWNPLAIFFPYGHPFMAAFWGLPSGHTSEIHPPLDDTTYGKTHVAALICYEQALVWPLLWTLIRHHPTLILAPESVHWEKSAAIGDLEARLARGWGRLYGLPVALAINLPPASARTESDSDLAHIHQIGRG